MKTQCVVYHALNTGSKYDRNSQFRVDIEDFRQHLDIICKKPISVTDIDGLVSGSSNNMYSVHITFDDGHISLMNAAEVLSEYGYPATFFLTTEFCQKWKDGLKTNHIRDLYSMGLTLGTHGYKHRNLTSLSEKEVYKELYNSRAWLEDLIGSRIRFMSAPFGDVNNSVLSMAKKAGYRLVRSANEQINHVPISGMQVNAFMIRRKYNKKMVENIYSNRGWWLYKRRLGSKYPQIIKSVNSIKRVFQGY